MHNIVFSPDYAKDDTIFTASWDRFIKSTDRGHTWTQVHVSPPPPKSPLRQFVIAVSPAYATDGTIFLGTRQGDMYVSTHRGDAGSWKELTRFGVDVGIRSIVISPDFATDHVIYVGTANGIRRSADGGVHWSATGPTGLAMLAMSPDYPKDGTVFAATGSSVFVTRDQGKTWAAITDTSLPPNGRPRPPARRPKGRWKPSRCLPTTPTTGRCWSASAATACTSRPTAARPSGRWVATSTAATC